MDSRSTRKPTTAKGASNARPLTRLARIDRLEALAVSHTQILANTAVALAKAAQTIAELQHALASVQASQDDAPGVPQIFDFPNRPH